MKRIGFIYGLLFCLVLSVAAQEKVVKLKIVETSDVHGNYYPCLLYTSPSPRDRQKSRMPSSA